MFIGVKKEHHAKEYVEDRQRRMRIDHFIARHKIWYKGSRVSLKEEIRNYVFDTGTKKQRSRYSLRRK